LKEGAYPEAGIHARVASSLTDDIGIGKEAKAVLDMAYRQLGLVIKARTKKADAHGTSAYRGLDHGAETIRLYLAVAWNE